MIFVNKLLRCKMKIAIFLSSETMNTLDKNFIQVIIFSVKDQIVVGVEKDFHRLKNLDSLALWLISRTIKEVYVEEVEDYVKAFLLKIDIKVKTFEEMKDNPILKAFIIQ